MDKINGKIKGKSIQKNKQRNEHEYAKIVCDTKQEKDSHESI